MIKLLSFALRLLQIFVIFLAYAAAITIIFSPFIIGYPHHVSRLWLLVISFPLGLTLMTALFNLIDYSELFDFEQLKRDILNKELKVIEARRTNLK